MKPAFLLAVGVLVGCHPADTDVEVDTDVGADTDLAPDTDVDPDTDCVAVAWYADADGDGYGDAAAPVDACAAPAGTVADASDCDDDESAQHPGATEVCDDGLDDDCDGLDPCTWAGTLDPAAEADAVFVGVSATVPDWAGFEVEYAGDVDGDGRDDALITAELGGYPAPYGRVYVVYGASAPAGTVVLADGPYLQATSTGGYSNLGAVGVGDVDGDGLADWLAGFPGDASTGAAWLFYGGGTPLTGGSTFADAADAGFSGASGLGFAVGSAGDVDADGFADLWMSAVVDQQVYLFAGGSTRRAGTIDVADADATFDGNAAPENAFPGTRRGLSHADVDGDGADELVIAAWDAGVGYLHVYEGGARPAGTLGLADTVFTLLPAATGAAYQPDVAAPGDLDADGYGDLLVTLGYSQPSYAAEGYAFSGGATGWPAARDLAAATARFAGDSVAGDAYHATASAGDVDGDGALDVAFTRALGQGRPGLSTWVYSGPGFAGVYAEAEASAIFTVAGDAHGTCDRVGGTIAGDLDGDGLDDLLLGNETEGGSAGAVWWVRGSRL
jgi:hypothetical protein